MKFFVILSILLLAHFPTKVSGFIDGYILDVKAGCGADESSPSAPTIVSDLSIIVELECKDGYYEEVSVANDFITYTGAAKFSGNSKTECIFMKRANSKTYSIKVYIGYGNPGSDFMPYLDEYLLTCVYSDTATFDTGASDIGVGLTAPDEIQRNVGGTASSTFDLKVTDVLGNVLTSSVAIGKKIKLVADMTGTGSEVSATAVSCDAVGSNSNRYAVLRAGCGDGIVFTHKQGFQTKGTKITSPFFSSFKLFNSATVAFECNFTVCSANCDGLSCTQASAPKSRRRRHAEENMITPAPKPNADEAYVISSSRILSVTNGENHEPQKQISMKDPWPRVRGSVKFVQSSLKADATRKRNNKPAWKRAKLANDILGTKVKVNKEYKVKVQNMRSGNREHSFWYIMYILTGLLVSMVMVIFVCWVFKKKDDPERVKLDNQSYIAHISS